MLVTCQSVPTPTQVTPKLRTNIHSVGSDATVVKLVGCCTLATSRLRPFITPEQCNRLQVTLDNPALCTRANRENVSTSRSLVYMYIFLQFSVVCKAQVAYRPSTRGNGSVMVVEGFRHGVFYANKIGNREHLDGRLLTCERKLSYG